MFFMNRDRIEVVNKGHRDSRRREITFFKSLVLHSPHFDIVMSSEHYNYIIKIIIII